MRISLSTTRENVLVRCLMSEPCNAMWEWNHQKLTGATYRKNLNEQFIYLFFINIYYIHIYITGKGFNEFHEIR